MLNYDIAYHLRCELELRTGRRVTLQSLNQSMTYSGWMEGVPWMELNDRKVESARRIPGSCPFLIPPVRSSYLRIPGDMDGQTGFGGRAAEWLPMVTCVGSFQSITPVRDHGKDMSVLTVVWFQNEYALPIEPKVLEQLCAIDWEQVAEDVEV